VALRTGGLELRRQFTTRIAPAEAPLAIVDVPPLSIRALEPYAQPSAASEAATRLRTLEMRARRPVVRPAPPEGLGFGTWLICGLCLAALAVTFVMVLR
jgi:hypothetical protein